MHLFVKLFAELEGPACCWLAVVYLPPAPCKGLAVLNRIAAFVNMCSHSIRQLTEVAALIGNPGKHFT